MSFGLKQMTIMTVLLKMVVVDYTKTNDSSRKVATNGLKQMIYH